MPRANVIAEMRRLTEEARERVCRSMYDMAEEWLEPMEIEGVPFNAYCDYPGRRQLLNLHHPHTVQSLKHLACHEAFPCHLVHLALRERYVADGTMPADAAQVVTSSASSALFEGIADNGIFFLDWVETPEDELAVGLQRLRSAVRCNAAWMLHGEGRPEAEVAETIARLGYQSVETVRNQLGFLQHGLRAPFVYSYWCGDIAVHELWKHVAREQRAEFWKYLYENMHTPTTLATHWVQRSLG